MVFMLFLISQISTTIDTHNSCESAIFAFPPSPFEHLQLFARIILVKAGYLACPVSSLPLG